MKLKNYKSTKYRTIYLANMPVEEVSKKGYLLYTFGKQTFINLNNGKALHEESKSIVSIYFLYDEIRHVRNLQGEIVAKRKNKHYPLKKVRFERKGK
jgi:hypothetical protein